MPDVSEISWKSDNYKLREIYTSASSYLELFALVTINMTNSLNEEETNVLDEDK